MANNNAPFGFRQFSGTGSVPTFEQVEVAITAGTAGAIFFGDPVSPLADGSVAQAVSSSATTPLQLAGIFAGCKYLSVAQKRTIWANYYPGGTDPVVGSATAYIINDPNAQFVVQSDATGVAPGDVNATFGFVIGTGNTANGISGAYLTVANAGVAGNPFRVVSIIKDPPTAPGTLGNGQPFDWAVVAFNNVQTKTAVSI